MKTPARKQPKGDHSAAPSSVLPSQEQPERKRPRESFVSFRPTKHERAEARRRIESVHSAEEDNERPNAGDVYLQQLKSSSHLSLEQIAGVEALEQKWKREEPKWERQEQRNRDDYTRGLNVAIADARRRSSSTLAYLLPYYGMTLLRDVLRNQESFEALKDLYWEACGGDTGARTEVKNIADALQWWGGGRPQSPQEEKRKTKSASASRSRSIARWTRYFDKCLLLHPEPEKAWRQLENDFNAQARFRDPNNKRLTLQQIYQRLTAKYPALQSKT